MINRFELKTTENSEGYLKGRILKILDDYQNKKIRIITTNPGSKLHNVLHNEQIMDSSKDFENYTNTRKNICEAFGIPENPKHIFYYTTPERKEGLAKQRAVEAFYVLIDLQKDPEERAFFCEGRTDHQKLLSRIIKELGLDEKEVFKELGKDHPEKYIMFKGFIGENVPRGDQEQDIFDEEGKINTPSDWFITGHNSPTGKEKY